MFKCAPTARSMFRGFLLLFHSGRARQQKKENPDITRVGIFNLLKPSIILNLCLRVLFTATKIDIIFQTNKFFGRKNEKSSTIVP